MLQKNKNQKINVPNSVMIFFSLSLITKFYAEGMSETQYYLKVNIFETQYCFKVGLFISKTSVIGVYFGDILSILMKLFQE